MKTNPNQIQQGDLIANKIKKLPKGIKEIKSKNGKFSLNYILNGNSTGNSHEISSVGVKIYKGQDTIFLKCGKIIKSSHIEHDSIQFAKGIWEIGHVVEKDYFLDMVRAVVD